MRLREMLLNKGAAVILVSGILLATAHRLPAQTAPATSSEVVFVLTLDPAQSQLHWNVDSSLHMDDALIDAARFHQRNSQVIMNSAVLRLALQSQLELACRFFKATGFEEDAKIVEKVAEAFLG